MIEPKQLGVDEPSGHSTPDEIVVVYSCPRCKSYFGSSSMSRLENLMNRKLDTGEETHARSQCPYCHSPRERRYARLIPKDEVAEVERKVLSEIEKAKKAKDKQEVKR